MLWICGVKVIHSTTSDGIRITSSSDQSVLLGSTSLKLDIVVDATSGQNVVVASSSAAAAGGTQFGDIVLAPVRTPSGGAPHLCTYVISIVGPAKLLVDQLVEVVSSAFAADGRSALLPSDPILVFAENTESAAPTAPMTNAVLTQRQITPSGWRMSMHPEQLLRGCRCLCIPYNGRLCVITVGDSLSSAVLDGSVIGLHVAATHSAMWYLCTNEKTDDAMQQEINAMKQLKLVKPAVHSYLEFAARRGVGYGSGSGGSEDYNNDGGGGGGLDEVTSDEKGANNNNNRNEKMLVNIRSIESSSLALSRFPEEHHHLSGLLDKLRRQALDLFGDSDMWDEERRLLESHVASVEELSSAAQGEHEEDLKMFSEKLKNEAGEREKLQEQLDAANERNLELEKRVAQSDELIAEYRHSEAAWDENHEALSQRLQDALHKNDASDGTTSEQAHRIEQFEDLVKLLRRQLEDAEASHQAAISPKSQQVEQQAREIEELRQEVQEQRTEQLALVQEFHVQEKRWQESLLRHMKEIETLRGDNERVKQIADHQIHTFKFVQREMVRERQKSHSDMHDLAARVQSLSPGRHSVAMTTIQQQLQQRQQRQYSSINNMTTSASDDRHVATTLSTNGSSGVRPPTRYHDDESIAAVLNSSSGSGSAMAQRATTTVPLAITAGAVATFNGARSATPKGSQIEIGQHQQQHLLLSPAPEHDKSRNSEHNIVLEPAGTRTLEF